MCVVFADFELKFKGNIYTSIDDNFWKLLGFQKVQFGEGRGSMPILRTKVKLLNCVEQTRCSQGSSTNIFAIN